mmetsp:Transcript_48786/g.116121  ORF Transcript_48786/g.116121 Transcript_48786/m.116121 type:complete len:232 (+) Transcript_48786:852-1547(+)
MNRRVFEDASVHAGGRGGEETCQERVSVSTGSQETRKGVVCCAGRPPLEPALDGQAHETAHPGDQPGDHADEAGVVAVIPRLGNGRCKLLVHRKVRQHPRQRACAFADGVAPPCDRVSDQPLRPAREAAEEVPAEVEKRAPPRPPRPPRLKLPCRLFEELHHPRRKRVHQAERVPEDVGGSQDTRHHQQHLLEVVVLDPVRDGRACPEHVPQPKLGKVERNVLHLVEEEPR